MYTIQYKAFFIHGYLDRSDCRIVTPLGTLWCNARTLVGAKRMITRALRDWPNLYVV